MKIDVTFNGKSLSREVPGFCLLSIEGRETQANKVADLKIPGRWGTDFQTAEYDAKTIKVKYKIYNVVNRRLADLYNALQYILSAPQAPLVFDDEPDKYWIATCSQVTANTLTFACTDPIKHAMTEKSFPMQPTSSKFVKTFEIENAGTVAVPVRYEMCLYDESGYIGIAGSHGDGDCMEFGQRDEQNEVFDRRDQMAINWDDFKSAGYDLSGKHAIKTANVTQTVAGGKSLDWLMLDTSRGDKTHTPGAWCHAMKTVPVNGVMTSDTSIADVKDFEFKAQTWFECADPAQIGEQAVEFIGQKGGREFQICRLSFTKDSAALSAQIHMHVNGNLVRSIRFAPNASSSFAKGTSGYFAIRKIGNTVTFYPQGPQNAIVKTDAAIDGAVLTRVRISFGHRPGAPMLTRNYLHGLTLTAKNVEGLWAVRNTFFPDSDGLNITIDGETSKIYQDADYRPDLEILGSKWFQIPPGKWQVNVVFSDWFEGRASGNAYIREGWL